jgi:hypothetical protein
MTELIQRRPVTMRLVRIVLISTVLLATTLPSFALSHARRGPTSQKLFNSRRAKPMGKRLGQASIDSDRATEIQVALIKSGYMGGLPSGVWDTSTQSAMQKLQSDNGWQTKLVPDSRAIIKLGLGPAQDTPSSSAGLTSSPTFDETRSPSASTY